MNGERSLLHSVRGRCLTSLLAVGLLNACTHSDGDRKAASADSLPSVAAKATGTSDPPPDTFRVSTGSKRVDVAANAINWNATTVADQLRGIGLMTEMVDVVARPMFRVRGQRFRINGGRAIVEAYFYGDANAVAIDNDKLDTVQVMPKGGAMRWEMAARLIVDNNMAAVVLTDEPSLRKTIEAALRSALHGSSQAR